MFVWTSGSFVQAPLKNITRLRSSYKMCEAEVQSIVIHVFLSSDIVELCFRRSILLKHEQEQLILLWVALRSGGCLQKQMKILNCEVHAAVLAV